MIPGWKQRGDIVEEQTHLNRLDRFHRVGLDDFEEVPKRLSVASIYQAWKFLVPRELSIQMGANARFAPGSARLPNSLLLFFATLRRLLDEVISEITHSFLARGCSAGILSKCSSRSLSRSRRR